MNANSALRNVRQPYFYCKFGTFLGHTSTAVILSMINEIVLSDDFKQIAFKEGHELQNLNLLRHIFQMTFFTSTILIQKKLIVVFSIYLFLSLGNLVVILRNRHQLETPNHQI